MGDEMGIENESLTVSDEGRGELVLAILVEDSESISII